MLPYCSSGGAMTEPRAVVRACLVISTAWLTLAFSGVAYGWTDMQVIMERNGIFCDSNCDSATPTFDAVAYNHVITTAMVRQPSPTWLSPSSSPSSSTAPLARIAR